MKILLRQATAFLLLVFIAGTLCSCGVLSTLFDDGAEKARTPAELYPSTPTEAQTSDPLFFTALRNQLTPNELAIYDALKNATSATESLTIKLPQPVLVDTAWFSDEESDETLFAEAGDYLNATLRRAIYAFGLDFPSECLWHIFTSCDCPENTENDPHLFQTFYASKRSLNGKTTMTEVKITLPLKDAYAGENLEKWETAKAEALSFVAKGETRYAKIRNINNFIKNHATYNLTSPYRSDFVGFYENGRILCEGYAELFKILCNQNDIPCLSVLGTAYTSEEPDGEGHMWNYVQMENGRWYAVDVTWNDTINTNDYLLIGEGDYILGTRFEQSHVVIDLFADIALEFTLPEISKTKYTIWH